MDLFGWAKSAPKAIDDVFDKDNGHLAKIGGWIGNQQFTDQEQAELMVGVGKSVQDFAVATLAENTERSKSRRDLAILTLQFYFLLVFMTGITYLIDKEWSALWFKLATIPTLLALVGGVGLFFWGTHTLRSSKWAKDKE